MNKRTVKIKHQIHCTALLSLLALVVFGSANAEELLNQWVNIQPQGTGNALGGSVRTIEFGVGNHAYVVSRYVKMFHRETSSQPWQYSRVVYKGIEKNVYSVIANKESAGEIMIIASDAGADSTLGNALLKSVDNGKTWSSLLTAKPNEGVRQIAIAPSDPNIVYATVFAVGAPSLTLLRSIDSGTTWSIVNTTDLSDIPIKIQVDAAEPTTVYMLQVLGNKPLSRSKDGGSTWSPLFSDIATSRPIKDFAVDPGRAGTLYAGTGDYFINGETEIYKSIDSAESWVRVGIPDTISNGLLRSLVVHPANSDIVYATAGVFSYSFVYRSLDAGQNWEKVDNPDDLIVDGPIVVSNFGEVLTSSSQGLATLNDQEQLISSNQGFSQPSLRASYLPKNRNDLIYAFDQAVGMITTDPALPNWSVRNNGLGQGVDHLVVHDDDGQHLLAGTFFGPYLSVNGGEQWTALNWPFEIAGVFDLAVAPTSATQLYARAFDGLVTSPDGGTTWITGLRRDDYPAGDISGPLVASHHNADVAYIGTFESGIYHTIDAGLKWEPMNTPFSSDWITDITEDPAKPGVLWVATLNGAVWRTQDAGLTWHNLTANLPTSSKSGLVSDPFVEDRVFLVAGLKVWAWNPLNGLWKYLDGPPRAFSTSSSNPHLSADQNVPGRLVYTWGEISELHADSDDDGLGDAIDNCILIGNSVQHDSDLDGIGNACDTDIAPKNNDCIVNFLDLAAVRQAFATVPGDANWNADADFNSDGSVNFVDIDLFRSQFLGAPGASGLTTHCP